MNNASKVIVITGASPGVGRATARRFARDGEEIALLGRGRDGTIAATIVFLALSKIDNRRRLTRCFNRAAVSPPRREC